MASINLNKFLTFLGGKADNDILSVSEEAIKFGNTDDVTMSVRDGSSKIEPTDKGMAKNVYIRQQILDMIRKSLTDKGYKEDHAFFETAEQTLFGQDPNVKDKKMYDGTTGTSDLTVGDIKTLLQKVDLGDVSNNPNNQPQDGKEIKFADKKEVDPSEWEVVDSNSIEAMSILEDFKGVTNEQRKMASSFNAEKLQELFDIPKETAQRLKIKNVAVVYSLKRVIFAFLDPEAGKSFAIQVDGGGNIVKIVKA